MSAAANGDRGGWAALNRELDAWGAAGRTATLWWRDDDATAPTPALDRLLDLAAAAAAPLALAVIPDAAEAALATRLEGQAAAGAEADVQVLQHGCAHRNHAPEGAKKCELVGPALRPGLAEDLQRGRKRLEAIFGARFLPVVVPPWNRLDPALLPQLPGLGFAGLSTYQARAGAAPVAGLVQVNCHLDILQWRPERRFLGTPAALELLTGHLAARRRGEADPAEPSGILTHHLVHDAAAWDFLAALLARLTAHPAARLLGAAAVFGLPARSAEAGRRAAGEPRR